MLKRKRLRAALVIAIVCRSVCGVCLAATSTAFDPAVFTPPGTFAGIDTHRLYYRCVGQAAPTVVIDTGIAGAAVEWTDIQDALASEARVCTYDRAGYGWSDPGPAPRTTERAVAELRTLLQVAHVPPPYVLVGHSFGGFDVRYFAAHFPAEVAGLVLVESSHPSEALSGAGGIRNAQHHPFPRNGALLEEGITIDHFTLARYLNSRRKAIFAQMDELANFNVSAEQALRAGALPAVPLIVLARDPQLGEADVALEARWQAHQRALSHLTTEGELRVVAHTGHEIHRDQPLAVITAIRDALSRSRHRMSQNR